MDSATNRNALSISIAQLDNKNPAKRLIPQQGLAISSAATTMAFRSLSRRTHRKKAVYELHGGAKHLGTS